MAANDAVSMNVAENRQNVPMAIQENRAAVPMTVAEGGGTPGGLNRKADKVTGATAGNLAGLDSTGNLTDSGKAPGDFLEAPASAGTQGQVLTADGEGGGSWQDPTGGDPTEIIDDEAGSGDTDKVWSADKSHELLTEINSKADEPTGTKTAGKVYGLDSNLNPAWVEGGGGGSASIDDTAGAGVTDKAWSADKLTTVFNKKTNAIVKTKSGSYVDMADAAGNAPLQSCIVNIDENEGQNGIKIKRIGKNLLHTVSNNRLNPYMTINGVKFTVNADGTVDAKGTSTGDIEFYLNDFYDAVFKNRRCYLSGTPLGGGANTFYIMAWKYIGISVAWDYGAGSYFTADERCLFKIVIKSGVQIDTTFKPMVQYADNGTIDEEYAPYEESEYSVSWEDVAGAITDGQFNATTGELTVTAPTAGEYQLDPVEIKTAKGFNTIFAVLAATTNNQSTGSVSVVYSVDEEGLIKDAVRKEVSILFIGNSLTQDCVSYLPFVIRKLCPELKFRFYIYYNPSLTLAEQYSTKISPDNVCEIFSVAENTDVWTNMNSSVKLSTVLSNYQFDIVCMQEYFNNMQTYTVSDLAAWNNIQQYVISHYKGGNGLKFVTLFHAPRRYSTETVMTAQKEGCALFLTDTVCEDMIPAGLAIYRAMDTALDSLGDAGHLSFDDTHAQEGIPCLIQTFSIYLWLLDLLGIGNKSIYGTNLRMDGNLYAGLNIPGPHIGTGFIKGTEEQNILTQEVAIMAYKEGKKFVADNLSNSN